MMIFAGRFLDLSSAAALAIRLEPQQRWINDDRSKHTRKRPHKEGETQKPALRYNFPKLDFDRLTCKDYRTRSVFLQKACDKLFFAN